VKYIVLVLVFLASASVFASGTTVYTCYNIKNLNSQMSVSFFSPKTLAVRYATQSGIAVAKYNFRNVEDPGQMDQTNVFSLVSHTSAYRPPQTVDVSNSLISGEKNGVLGAANQVFTCQRGNVN